MSMGREEQEPARRATRSTAIACKRLIAVSYDDFQTELPSNQSRYRRFHCDIRDQRGLSDRIRLASGGDTFSENPNGVHDFEQQLHIQSPGIANRGACFLISHFVAFYLARLTCKPCCHSYPNYHS